ncbi:hypothetical protein JHK84_041231 [Glycine max]|nr:hypothetical protein JHK86_041025 [Glycine max]KAG5122891.1 hypothetical protein JHK84_041231 [Glycine max]
MKEVRMKKIEDLLENLTEFSNKGIVGWNALGNLENGGHRDGVEAGSFWYGEDGPPWLGSISYKYPSYLTGEMPGDYDFDIVGLGQDPVEL